MKRSKKYKQKFQANVGHEADSNKHSTPVPTVGFDEQTAQLGLWGV